MFLGPSFDGVNSLSPFDRFHLLHIDFPKVTLHMNIIHSITCSNEKKPLKQNIKREIIQYFPTIRKT